MLWEIYDSSMKNKRSIYPSEYDGPKPIKEQIKIITKMFRLDSANALEYVKKLPKLPAGAEGWFAILSDKGLQKLFPQITDIAGRYCAGVRLAHKKIATSREFYNYHDDKIISNSLRVSNHTTEALAEIVKDQPGDILIIAGQLGMRHRDTGSAYNAYDKYFKPKESGEFGLGSLAGCSIILVHPNRLVRFEDLGMDLLGDKFIGVTNRYRDPVYLVPNLNITSSKLAFGAKSFDIISCFSGSVSAFFP